MKKILLASAIMLGAGAWAAAPLANETVHPGDPHGKAGDAASHDNAHGANGNNANGQSHDAPGNGNDTDPNGDHTGNDDPHTPG